VNAALSHAARKLARSGRTVRGRMAAVLLVLGALFFLNTFMVLNGIRSREENGRVINVAGRQRMLVQTALLRAYQIQGGDDAARRGLAETMGALDNAFAELAGETPAGDRPPASVRPALERARSVWEAQRAHFDVVRQAPAESVRAVFALGSAEAAAPYVLDSIESMVAAYEEAFHRDLVMLGRFVVIMAVTGALVAGASWWWLYARLTGPLLRLREGAQRLAAGDWRFRVDDDALDEVGSLARQFNAMAARLEDAYGQLADHAARLEEANRELEQRALRDPLTGLLNHGAIDDTLAQLALDGFQGGRVGVAVVDVDGMKATNDTYGHATGDRALVTVARALRRHGAIVGRYGGDEFVAVLPGADRLAAERYRDAVLEALRRSPLFDRASGASFPVTVTIGLAVYPDDTHDPRDLIPLADAAMYVERRRQRAQGRKRGRSRALDDEHAARLIGEMVPLLVGPGELDEKLRLVAHRLSLGAGYDAVDVRLLWDLGRAPVSQNTFARTSDDLVERWSQEQRTIEDHVVRRTLRETRAPLIIEDPWYDPRLTEGQRHILRAAGLRSALCAPMLWGDDLVGIVAVASKRERAFGPRDARFLMTVATQITGLVRTEMLVDELQRTSRRLADAQAETVMMLAAAAEARDRITGQHLQNIRGLTEALARELGYSDAEAAEIALAAVLHDIGKIRVPDAVLASTSVFGAEERGIMSRHTVWGYELLQERPGFELAAKIARWHHERWDGAGYPDGVAGDAIPEPVCIVSVADAFDAMTGERPYRTPMDPCDAVTEIRRNAGTQFSPRVVAALVRLYEQGALPRPCEDEQAREAA
jgi:diguanylate cyclase (GGDEF)-like protein